MNREPLPRGAGSFRLYSLGKEYNLKLSLRRAEAVRDYLAGLGVKAKKMKVSGAGEANPVASNSTNAGRAKNRRVEIEVIGLGK